MDIVKEQRFKSRMIDKFNRNNSKLYDYEENGILDKCLPKVLFRGNPILVSFLQLIDTKCIMMLKYVDRIKRFKHITKF